MTDPQPPNPSELVPANGAPEVAVETQPSAAQVDNVLRGIERATTAVGGTATQRTWLMGNGPVIVFLVLLLPAMIGLSLLVTKGIQRARRTLSQLSSEVSNQRAGSNPVDPAVQREAEALLARAATGDAASISKVLAEAPQWTGKTQRTPQTDQSLTTALNSSDLKERAAAIAANLALENVPADQTGLTTVQDALGDPGQRSWALWMIGALGNRGVDPVHTAKIAETYLNDPDAQVRVAAVNALSIIATDETIPMLLDRFRNDPSPLVQEQAACGLSSSGMYTHAQRLHAAASFVTWLDDPLLSAQQRGWVLQGLTDISQKNFGANPSAWRAWYRSQSVAS